MTITWLPPAPGPLIRGTVILLPGRGEHAGVYERLGRRLAADAYAVHGLDTSVNDHPSAIAKEITAVSAHAVAPVVLAGSDIGALQALALVASGTVTVDGLLLAGLPTPGIGFAPVSDPDGNAEWDWELAARTSCPVHRGRLTDDPAFSRGGLAQPFPEQLDPFSPDRELSDVRTPTLLLHGGADPIAPLESARAVAASLPHAELVYTEGGQHDVLNDATHRTVAAHIIQWLERLRNGPLLDPIVKVEAPISALVGN